MAIHQPERAKIFPAGQQQRYASHGNTISTRISTLLPAGDSDRGLSCSGSRPRELGTGARPRETKPDTRQDRSRPNLRMPRGWESCKRYLVPACASGRCLSSALASSAAAWCPAVASGWRPPRPSLSWGWKWGCWRRWTSPVRRGGTALTPAAPQVQQHNLSSLQLQAEGSFVPPHVLLHPLTSLFNTNHPFQRYKSIFTQAQPSPAKNSPRGTLTSEPEGEAGTLAAGEAGRLLLSGKSNDTSLLVESRGFFFFSASRSRGSEPEWLSARVRTPVKKSAISS